MYKVSINKDSLKNHFQYDWWKYIVAVLVTIFLWSFITTVTEPRTPADQMIEMFLVGGYALDESLMEIEEAMLEDFPNLLEVNIDNIAIGEDEEMDFYGRQKLMVMLGSQTGDLYVFEKEEFKSVAEQGAFFSLELYIDEYEDLIDLDELEEFKSYNFDDEIEYAIFGLPLKGLTLFERTGFDVEDKYIGVMVFSDNIEGAFDALTWILKDGKK